MSSLTIWFLLCIVLSAYSSTQDDSIAKFLKQYVSEYPFPSLRYSIIACNRESGFNLFQGISNMHHGMATIQTTKEKLEAWVNLDEPQMFIANLDCFEMRKILWEANEIGLFRKPFVWLLLDLTSFNFTEEKATGSMQTPGWYWDVLKNFNILPDGDVKISKRVNNNKIDIIGIYKVIKNASIIKENLAGWSEEYGLMIRDKECPAVRRSNLQGVTLSSSLQIRFTKNLKSLEENLENRRENPASIVGYMMLKYLGEMLNATMDFKIVGSVGENQNGRWGGMIGDILSGDVDLGATPTTINPKLFPKLEYYAKVTPSRYKFIFQSPPLSYSNNIFTLPFDRTVWYCCFGMIAASSIVLFIAVKFENRNRSKTDFPDIVGQLISRKKVISSLDTENHVMSQKVHNALEDSFSDIVMLNVGAICLQGTVVEPKGPSGRIIAIFLYFCYMFLYVSYSACIVALLQSSDKSIKTLRDLLESPLEVGADDVDYSRNYFETDTDPIRKGIYENKIAPKGEPAHFLPVSEGIKNVRNGLYAYHVDTNKGYHEIQKAFTEDEKCGLQELEISFFPNMDSYLTISKHSPYAEIIKIGIKKILERGLQNRIQNSIYTDKPVCGSKGSSFVSVGLVDSYPAFMVLLYGLGLALFIIVTEKFYKHRTRKKLVNDKHD